MLRIDPDVRGMAAHFGVDAALIQAVVKAEGNILRAVQCSIPSCQTREQALQILCRSAVHALSDFVQSKQLQKEFVEAWAKKWAPVGAGNDPTSLNQNWPVNVLTLWGVNG